MNNVTSNLTGLQTLRRQLGELEAGRVQVGLFGETSGRSAEPGRINSNPQLGAIHEFGLSYTVVKNKASIQIPERSWLRMPLILHLGKLISARGTDWLWLLRNRGARRVLAFLGLVAEDVIQEGFNTGGWGSWAPLAETTIQRKGSARILIEIAQMRKAVASRVV